MCTDDPFMISLTVHYGDPCDRLWVIVVDFGYDLQAHNGFLFQNLYTIHQSHYLLLLPITLEGR